LLDTCQDSSSSGLYYAPKTKGDVDEMNKKKRESLKKAMEIYKNKEKQKQKGYIETNIRIKHSISEKQYERLLDYVLCGGVL